MRWLKTVLILIVVPRMQTAALTRKYSRQSVPNSGWFPMTTVTDVKSLMHCEGKAREADQYSFSHDENSRNCLVGSIDLSAAGAADTTVYTIDMGHVGLAHGGTGFTDFEVVLPNGKVCPPSENGLPPVGLPRERHGIAEMDGIMYVCGGKLDSSDDDTDECLTLNLTDNNPAWETMASLLDPKTLALGDGLIPYKNLAGETMLFAFSENLCDGSNYVEKYFLGNWSAAGTVSPTKFAPTVRHDSLVYIVSGLDCNDNQQRINVVQMYDLDQPDKQALLLSHPLSTGSQNFECTVMPIHPVKGLLCAGGNDGSKTKTVQFLPLTEDGRDSSGPCWNLPELPEKRTHAKPFYFWETGQAVLYGGQGTGSDTQNILNWNPATRMFEDLGLSMTEYT